MAITGFLFLGYMSLLILLIVLAYFIDPYNETAAKAIMVVLPIVAISGQFIVLLLL